MSAFGGNAEPVGLPTDLANLRAHLWVLKEDALLAELNLLVQDDGPNPVLVMAHRHPLVQDILVDIAKRGPVQI